MAALLLHSPLSLFIVQAVIIIAFSRLLGTLARRLDQPMVIAEVLAGILLGPSLLGLLLPRVEAALFPLQSLSLLHIFSQVGLILFMFLIGLELDPKLLRGRGRASVLVSQAGMLMPFILGGLLAFYLYPILSQPQVPFSSFALFLGTAMSITAFPVLARILSEHRLLHSRVGVMAITCAAIGDVVGWCVLAFVVSLVRAGGLHRAVGTTVATLLYSGVMIGVVRPFLRRLGARASNREGLTQNTVAVTFILLLLSSWTTELIGIHALFGAFLMGTIMPKEGGFATTLADKLEDIAVVFLLPLFFAYSGLRTQIGLLNSLHTWGLCGLIILVACAGKFGGSTVAARLTGVSWRESSALGILMNTRGLMELVVLNIGFDLGVISPTLFTMMVLMALVTTFMTTPLLQLIYPPKELAQQLVEMSDSSDRLYPTDAFCVLMCVSYYGSARGMLMLAEALVRNVRPHSRIYALKLLRPSDRTSFYLNDAQDGQGAASVLAPLIEQGQVHGLQVRPLSFVSGHPARDICDVAEVKDADLVLLGWQRPLLNRAALGGTVNEVLESARANVAVLVDRGLHTLRRVLVPYHGTDHDRASLALAQRLLKQAGVQVTVLHVVSPSRSPQERRLGVQQQVEAVFQEAGLHSGEVQIKVVEHISPAEAALSEAAAQTYDLVLIGVGEEWGLQQRQFGIQQEYIIRKCPTSLLVVRKYDPKVQGIKAPLAGRAPQVQTGNFATIAGSPESDPTKR